MTLPHTTLFALEQSIQFEAFDTSVMELIKTSLLAVGHQGQDAGPLSTNLVYGWCQVWMAQLMLPDTCNSSQMCQGLSLSLWPAETSRTKWSGHIASSNIHYMQ